MRFVVMLAAVTLLVQGCNHRAPASAASAPMPHVPADTTPVATASAGSSSSSMPLEHTATAADLAELTGKELKLTKFIFANKVQPLPGAAVPVALDQNVTLELLAEGHVAGQAPVNRYSGDLHLNQDGQCNWAKPIVTTRMAGSPKAMESEDRFLATLGNATHLIRSGDGLRFETADKSGAVEFHSAQ